LNREDAQTIPIIAMTANAYREDIDRALAAGMNDHLAKPIDIAEVLKTLDKWLGGD
jgi:CheY-like chemotaxis protein